MRKESQHVTVKKSKYRGKQQEKKRTKYLYDMQKTVNKMAIGSPFLSVITLNVNIKFSKRHRMAKWIKNKKHDLTICCLQETYFRYKDIYMLKMKRWKK